MARDVMLARHTGRRVHVAHVSTAGSVEVIRWAKAQGIDVTAEVTPHHLVLTTDLLAGYDPRLQGQPAAAPPRGRRGPARGAGRRHHRRGGHRPRPARPPRQGARVRRRGLRHARARDRAVGRQRRHGRLRPARLGRRRPGDVRAPGPHRRARRPRRPLAVGAPANVTLVDPSAEVTVDRERLALALPQQPLARAAPCAVRCTPRCCAAESPPRRAASRDPPPSRGRACSSPWA